jgi:hypothetical protein
VDIRGCRFGFVKFKEVTNVTEFSKKLENVWFGTYKLRINLARFGREGIRGVQAANMGDGRVLLFSETGEDVGVAINRRVWWEGLLTDLKPWDPCLV